MGSTEKVSEAGGEEGGGAPAARRILKMEVEARRSGADSWKIQQRTSGEGAGVQLF